ncbi:MAG: STAS/SEC14 domain-containing protein [Planctomycetaceae bacterium]|nr:STAS/SEC14 domain-containing protein [Planctomycetaceae bacterium]MCP4778694.1 STAS/SEC14 domain-containing protein [Planctomycetaceae bacterium]
MLNVSLDSSVGIATLEPEGELTASDFSAAADVIDPFLEKMGELKGIIIYTKSFPSWHSFSSLVAHLKFIREHHKKVTRVAFVTDSPIGNIAEHVTSHFVSAEIKSFEFCDLASGKKWILGETKQ